MRNIFTLFLSLCLSSIATAQSTDFNYYKSLGIVQYYERNFLEAIFNLQKATTIKANDREVNSYLRMSYDSIGNKELAGKMRMKIEKFSNKGRDTRPVIAPAKLPGDSTPAPPGNKNIRSAILRPAGKGTPTDVSRELRQLADYFMDRESYDSAAMCYKHYMDLYPADTNTRFYLATSEYYTKKYDEAIFNYEIILHREPKRAELYNWIGVCELQRGNYLAARDNFKQCIKIDPDYSIAFFNLGKTQYELEDYGDAAKNLEKAQELLPQDADIIRMLADIYYNTGSWDKSRILYEELFALNKRSERINYRLGDLYMRASQWNKAIIYLNNFLELVPGSVEARKKIGIAYYNIEKYAAAVENFDKASKTLWDDKELMLYAAISANKLGNSQKAREYAERAITLDKNYTRAYYQLATAYKALGQNKQSKETLAKVKDLEMNAVQPDTKDKQ
jgi:tetratricopeptide (TPR) repeat protein